VLDQAIVLRGQMLDFLSQSADETIGFDMSRSRLIEEFAL
jgi:flagellar biosynthesis/type III secretory pathway ATPase